MNWLIWSLIGMCCYVWAYVAWQGADVLGWVHVGDWLQMAGLACVVIEIIKRK